MAAGPTSNQPFVTVISRAVRLATKISNPTWIKETTIAESFPSAAQIDSETEAAIKIAKAQSDLLQFNFS
jgi:hypothetical protein